MSFAIVNRLILGKIIILGENNNLEKITYYLGKVTSNLRKIYVDII
jgi:hypothetical protein